MTAISRAAAAYEASHALDQRPAAVLARAHQALAADLSAAIAAYEAGAFDRMCAHTARATPMLGALIAGISSHSPEADRLTRGYARLRTAVNRMLIDTAETQTVREGIVWTRNLTRSFLNSL